MRFREIVQEIASPDDISFFKKYGLDLSEPGSSDAASGDSSSTTPSGDDAGADLSNYKSVPGSVNPNDVKSYLLSKGLDNNQAAGILTNIKHESGFRPGVMGDGNTSGGLFQHHAARFSAMVKAAGSNWQTNWKGQVDFALSEPAGRQYAGMKFSSPAQAAEWWTINFEVPANKYAQASTRAASASRFA
jgi:hypothetical protein